MSPAVFVDFGRQLDPDGPRMFGFWLPARREFLRGNERSAWSSWQDLLDDEGYTHRDGEREWQLEALCPPWVSGELRGGDV